MSVGVGDPAPAFRLPATGGSMVALADLIGKPVVLVFYPGDDSPICTKQLNSYNRDLDDFEALDAHVLGISAQGIESHEMFAGKHGLKFPLLADTDKAVAGLYGTLGPLGFPRRSVFIVDRQGIIRYAHRAVAGLDIPPGQRAGRRACRAVARGPYYSTNLCSLRSASWGSIPVSPVVGTPCSTALGQAHQRRCRWASCALRRPIRSRSALPRCRPRSSPCSPSFGPTSLPSSKCSSK